MVEAGIVAVGDGDAGMVAEGSKPGDTSVGVNTSATTTANVGRLVSVMVGRRGSLILLSAKAVERPPKMNKKESVPKRMLPPRLRKACIFLPFTPRLQIQSARWGVKR